MATVLLGSRGERRRMKLELDALPRTSLPGDVLAVPAAKIYSAYCWSDETDYFIQPPKTAWDVRLSFP